MTALAVVAHVEDRQDPVAHELQDVAMVFVDRRHHAFEVVVHEGQKPVTRRRVGELRKALQIARPQRRADRFAGAALDRAAEDSLAGVLAEIGLDETVGDPIGRGHLHGEGDHGRKLLDDR